MEEGDSCLMCGAGGGIGSVAVGDLAAERVQEQQEAQEAPRYDIGTIIELGCGLGMSKVGFGRPVACWARNVNWPKMGMSGTLATTLSVSS